ncbi:MAG: hypothetical protein IJI36_07860 [Kiritimatiellae bacterium]|nr:hypothetical protein [Kiritimatiellia bacterium]
MDSLRNRRCKPSCCGLCGHTTECSFHIASHLFLLAYLRSTLDGPQFALRQTQFSLCTIISLESLVVFFLAPATLLTRNKIRFRIVERFLCCAKIGLAFGEFSLVPAASAFASALAGTAASAGAEFPIVVAWVF